MDPFLKINYNKIPLRHQLCADVSFASRFQMPLVQPYVGDIPDKIVAFYRARGHEIAVDTAIHFYTADISFECVWNRPALYIPMLQRFPFVISTDYSLYSDMLLPEIMWNTFRNKLLCAWWQKHGINVIPNVSWAKEWSLDFTLEGYPKNSIIAINSTGIGIEPKSKELWLNGYSRVIEELHPIHILRYGAKQAGEDESISTYYQNDNKNSINNGWKWFI